MSAFTEIGHTNISLMGNIRQVSTLALPILGFLAQVEEVPGFLVKEQLKVEAIMAHSPAGALPRGFFSSALRLGNWDIYRRVQLTPQQWQYCRRGVELAHVQSNLGKS